MSAPVTTFTAALPNGQLLPHTTTEERSATIVRMEQLFRTTWASLACLGYTVEETVLSSARS